MSDTFFNPDLQVALGGDLVRTMGGLAGFPDETFYAPTAARSREYTPETLSAKVLGRSYESLENR